MKTPAKDTALSPASIENLRRRNETRMRSAAKHGTFANGYKPTQPATTLNALDASVAISDWKPHGGEHFNPPDAQPAAHMPPPPFYHVADWIVGPCTSFEVATSRRAETVCKMLNNAHAGLLAEVARLRVLLDATQAACTEAIQKRDLGRVSPWQADCEEARWQELQHPLLAAARGEKEGA